VRERKLTAWLWLVGVLAALAYANRLLGGRPPRNEIYHYGLGAGGLVIYAVMAALVLWIARGLPRSVLGLRAPLSWPRALGLTLVLVVAILIAEQALEPVLHAGREQGLEPSRWQPSHADAFAFNAAVIVLVDPVVEELTFRGLGFGLLLRYGRLAAVGGTALAFALGHGLVQGLPALLIFGIGIALLRLRTGSVYPGMLLHACFNGAALAFSLTT
jgi:membrane protease YdiL (CAAX protease family)